MKTKILEVFQNSVPGLEHTALKVIGYKYVEKAIKHSTETPFTCSSLTFIAESKYSK